VTYAAFYRIAFIQYNRLLKTANRNAETFKIESTSN